MESYAPFASNGGSLNHAAVPHYNNGRQCAPIRKIRIFDWRACFIKNLAEGKINGLKVDCQPLHHGLRNFGKKRIARLDWLGFHRGSSGKAQKEPPMKEPEKDSQAFARV